MQINKVFVIDVEGKPLLPTSAARARLLLKNGKADTESMIPFTIRLRKKIDNPTGGFKVGVDDGSKHVGVAVVNDVTDEAVFVGEIKLRQDVKRLVNQRSQYRRIRRSRKLRNRKPRFNNRINRSLPPSIRTRKDSIIRFVKDMMRRVNITHATVEEVSFNHSKNKYGKQFSLVEIGKKYLRNQLCCLNITVDSVYGWMTAEWRKITGTPKSHYADAAVIIGKIKKITLPLKHFIILPRRNRVWKSNPTKKYNKFNGFCHWDIIKATRAGKKIVGCVRSFTKTQLRLRIFNDDNFPVSYSKSHLFWKPNGLVYI